MKIKLAIILLIFSTIIVVVKTNFAKERGMGDCHFLNQTYKKLSFNYKEDNNFEFAIKNSDVAQTELLFSNDQLVDLERQLIAADIIYQKVLELTPPLDKPRYREAKYIKVIMAPINGNGLSYDEVTADKELGASDCNISMKIKATLKAPNGTPAHELFHLYQSGYFMFKNGWLTEGTAQWSESLISKGARRKLSKTLPQTKRELREVMKLKYDASVMWTRLFELVDQQEVFILPKEAKSINYLNGLSVITDNNAYGTTFIKGLFEALEEQSKQAANDRGWETYNWKESDQKSADNNTYVWKAVQNAVNKAVPKAQQSEELKRFISISLSSS